MAGWLAGWLADVASFRKCLGTSYGARAQRAPLKLVPTVASINNESFSNYLHSNCGRYCATLITFVGVPLSQR